MTTGKTIALTIWTFVNKVMSPLFNIEIQVICVSDIDISPGNLDSSLCFFRSSVSHDVYCIEVKEAG